MNPLLVLFILIFLAGCSQNDELSSSALRRQNQQGEFLSRRQNDPRLKPEPPQRQPPPAYPWQRSNALALVTKDFFRCKGSPLNPEQKVKEGEKTRRCHDCSTHGLPLREGKEFIYPVLIELLNYLQKTTGLPVVITSGHRCPEHNSYIDPAAPELQSKHLIGAEVDFYIQGMEQEPDKLVALLQKFYEKEKESDYRHFQRYEKADTNVRTAPWYNKEIFIKLFQRDEGRNYDNRHPYPYISLQVRHDREKNERVKYEWESAHRGFLQR